MSYYSLIRKIPDYPIKGIVFEDMTTLWKDPEAFAKTIEQIADFFRDYQISKVVGLEARGFVVAAPIAMILGAGFIPVRKEGKLPYEKLSRTYSLEYGETVVEIHKDAISAQDRVLICDDILATGGTLEAGIQLVKELQGQIIGVGVLLELAYLNGREKLSTDQVFSVFKTEQP